MKEIGCFSQPKSYGGSLQQSRGGIDQWSASGIPAAVRGHLARVIEDLGEAVRDLDADKLSEASFNSFRAILQIGMEATRERRAMLMSAHSPTAVASD